MLDQRDERKMYVGGVDKKLAVIEYRRFINASKRRAKRKIKDKQRQQDIRASRFIILLVLQIQTLRKQTQMMQFLNVPINSAEMTQLLY